MPRRLIRYAAAPTVSLLLLAAVGAELSTRPRARDADPYHLRARQAIAAIPMSFGPWVGHDVPTPREAQALLHPNALLNRAYRDQDTGRTVNLLLVQCRDARDMVGHYPPVCYPNQGWTCPPPRLVQLQLGTVSIPMTEYDFRINRFGSPGRLLVYNFMLLPSGQFVPDIRQVNEAAADYTQHFLGAAQVQFVFGDDASVTQAQRLEVIKEFLDAMAGAIEAIGSGVPS